MNSSEAAVKLGTTPKELRRFLRADSSYTNAANTSSGRYSFTDSEFLVLKSRFDAWMNKNAGRKRPRPVNVDADKPGTAQGMRDDLRRTRNTDAPGLPKRFATARLTTSERERRDRLSHERVDRLEQRLLAAGLHISQLRREVS